MINLFIRHHLTTVTNTFTLRLLAYYLALSV